MDERPPRARQRLASDERRSLVIDASIRAFARAGYEGTTTREVAELAGVSQPHVIRLFGSKHALFLAAVERGFDRIEAMFVAAAESSAPGAELQAMGRAYCGLLDDRDELLLQLHTYAACADDEIAGVVRERYRQLVRVVQERSGAPVDDVWRFFAAGMLLNVIAAAGVAPIDEVAAWVERSLLPTAPG